MKCFRLIMNKTLSIVSRSEGGDTCGKTMHVATQMQQLVSVLLTSNDARRHNYGHMSLSDSTRLHTKLCSYEHTHESPCCRKASKETISFLKKIWIHEVSNGLLLQCYVIICERLKVKRHWLRNVSIQCTDSINMAVKMGQCYFTWDVTFRCKKWPQSNGQDVAFVCAQEEEGRDRNTLVGYVPMCKQYVLKDKGKAHPRRDHEGPEWAYRYSCTAGRCTGGWVDRATQVLRVNSNSSPVLFAARKTEPRGYLLTIRPNVHSHHDGTNWYTAAQNWNLPAGEVPQHGHSAGELCLHGTRQPVAPWAHAQCLSTCGEMALPFPARGTRRQRGGRNPSSDSWLQSHSSVPDSLLKDAPLQHPQSSLLQGTVH
jgi:hypothetical protein